MKQQPNNTFLKNLLKCSIEHINANAKWNEPDKETQWFQKAIYVPTKLDDKLMPVLLELKHSLVFLSGTPGSGKTQFLKEFKNQLLNNGYDAMPTDGDVQTVMTFQNNGNVVHIKHDATQVESEVDDAAVKLGELLDDDWSDANFEEQSKKANYVIGINQGVLQRLCDLDIFQKLGAEVRNQSDQRILVVDLSKRSAVFPGDHQNAFVTLLLLTLTEKEHWEDAPKDGNSIETCHGCELVESGFCPVLTNIQWLRGDSVWERIHDIFEMNHYISGNVTTFRDVLAILAKAIAGYWDYYGDKAPCDFIREEAERNDSASLMNLCRLLLYNGMFSDKDPFGEYLASLDLPKDERGRHVFFGYCGSYFSSDPDDMGTMAVLDPALSDSDEFRALDDEVFNFPKALLDSPDCPLESRLFEHIEQRLRNLESEDADNGPERFVRLRARDWLLYCLIRLGRRRHFLLGKTCGKELSRYEHAASFSQAIMKLAEEPGGAYSRRLGGDIKIALTAFSGTRDFGTMTVSHGSRDSEIAASLAFDISFNVFVPEPETSYIEHFPSEMQLLPADEELGNLAVQLTPLQIDLEVWECLQRAHAGFSASYLGIDRAKTIESFLQGLRSVAWYLRNCRIEISHGDTRVEIYEDRGGLIIR